MSLSDFLSGWFGGAAVVGVAVQMAPTLIGGGLGFAIGAFTGRHSDTDVIPEIMSRGTSGVLLMVGGLLIGAAVNVVLSVPLFACAVVCAVLFFILYPIGCGAWRLYSLFKRDK